MDQDSSGVYRVSFRSREAEIFSRVWAVIASSYIFLRLPVFQYRPVMENSSGMLTGIIHGGSGLLHNIVSFPGLADDGIGIAFHSGEVPAAMGNHVTLLELSLGNLALAWLGFRHKEHSSNNDLAHSRLKHSAPIS